MITADWRNIRISLIIGKKAKENRTLVTSPDIDS